MLCSLFILVFFILRYLPTFYLKLITNYCLKKTTRFEIYLIKRYDDLFPYELSLHLVRINFKMRDQIKAGLLQVKLLLVKHHQISKENGIL